jgi:DNA-directed RNA polymerase II subunit RPB2
MIKFECPHDNGGYFIINGHEKVLVAQERLIKNKIYVFKKYEKSTTKISCQCRFLFLF